MTSDAAVLIACESVLEPILEQLTAVLEEHSANFAGPWARYWSGCGQPPPTPASRSRPPFSRRSDRYHPSAVGPRCTLPPLLGELITAGSARAQPTSGETSETPGRSAIRRTAPVGAKRPTAGFPGCGVAFERARAARVVSRRCRLTRSGRGDPRVG